MSTGIVGPILGEISAQPAAAGAARYVNSSGTYWFAVGGLPFNIAPTDEHPYQRATAQFRKDQFDSSPTPGDQSLDGIWLRGQMSFHRGAGIKFYEALDGETTESRYFESNGLNPWTPGEVVLAPKLVQADATNVVDAAVRYDSASGDWTAYVLTAAGAVLGVTESASTALTSTTATSVAANDQEQTFVAAADKIQRLTTGTTFTDLITQSDGHDLVTVAWAKGRLFFVDADGRWYAEPNTVHSVAEADAFWDSQLPTVAGDWSVASSPSAVYLGRGSSIYAVIPSTDGTVPTLEAPTVVATLPPGETIRALGYSLGWLILATSSGIRVAASDASGQVSLGPILVEFSDSTCRQIGTWGNLAYVSGIEPGDSVDSLYMLELTRVIDTNSVAFTKRTDFQSPNTGSGAISANGQTVLFGAGGTYIESTSELEDTGFLTTGFIRFGTLEPKAFLSVRVKVDGTEGAVAISILRKGTAETLLASLPASRLGEQDIDLKLPAPEEYIGLKFTLTPGAGGTGPTLLGYQLRGLPAPANRSRMMSIPLLCYDSEEGKNGVRIPGGPGTAWGRLSALEGIEQAAGIVSFQDFRTGETGQAFIEEVDFLNRTPPKGVASGFGGIITLTIRKVS